MLQLVNVLLIMWSDISGSYSEFCRNCVVASPPSSVISCGCQEANNGPFVQASFDLSVYFSATSCFSWPLITSQIVVSAMSMVLLPAHNTHRYYGQISFPCIGSVVRNMRLIVCAFIHHALDSRMSADGHDHSNPVEHV